MIYIHLQVPITIHASHLQVPTSNNTCFTLNCKRLQVTTQISHSPSGACN